jgi:hypothetical protein
VTPLVHSLANTEDYNFWRFNIDLALLDTERRVHFFADLGECASAAHAIQAPVQTSAMDDKVHWDCPPLYRT